MELQTVYGVQCREHRQLQTIVFPEKAWADSFAAHLNQPRGLVGRITSRIIGGKPKYYVVPMTLCVRPPTLAEVGGNQQV